MEFELHSNKITSIPDRFYENLNSLCDLSIGNNKVESLSDDISTLKRLWSVNISRNDFKEIPASIYEMNWVIRFNAFGNKIKKIEKKIGDFKTLQKLYLGFNKITELPEELGELIHLKELFLSGNPLYDFPNPILKLVNLQQLYLSACGISYLPAFGTHFPNLQSLIISANQLNSLPDEFGSNLNKLVEFDASHNKITKIPECFCKLAALIDCDFSSNFIYSLPENLTKLKNLNQLKLINNQIQVVPECYSAFQQLGFIALAGNPLTSLPEKVREISEVYNKNILPNSFGKQEMQDGSNSDALNQPPKRGKLIENISWAEMKGIRPTQEDSVVIIENFLDSTTKQLFCVFDGHRGSTAALYVASHLPNVLREKLEHDVFPPEALVSTFDICNQGISEFLFLFLFSVILYPFSFHSPLSWAASFPSPVSPTAPSTALSAPAAGGSR